MDNNTCLYNHLYSFDNLWKAWRKARRGKRKSDGSLVFEAHAEEELFYIQNALKTESYQFSSYKTFTIHEPVKRIIAAAPFKDRVVHHSIMNIIEPLLEKEMIEDSYACRKGKGTHRALKKVQYLLSKSTWVLKLDIRKFFFTIDHELLLNQLSLVVDNSKLMNLINALVQTYSSDSSYYYGHEGDDLFSSLRKRGLPIGNLTSQWFANFYLTPLDKHIIQLPNLIGFIRYMDDMILFGLSKEDVKNWKKDIFEFMETIRLTPHPNKTQIFPVKNGVKFLGHHIWKDKRKILRPNLQRFNKRMKIKARAFENQEINREQIALGLNGWLGFVEKEGKIISDQILKSISFEPKQGLPFTFTTLY